MNWEEKPLALFNTGALIVNADDWGRDRDTTDRILDCAVQGSVSSASGMVFMEDSERSALIARKRNIDVGLHLNFTTRFSGRATPMRLIEHQERISRYLRRHRFSQVLFNPQLTSSFEYVVAAQLEEFKRLYGVQPLRIDGHHHMHLCANVLFGKLLPSGTIVRRSFCFARQEKGLMNRTYRRILDSFLARRHRIVDFFTTLAPLEPPRRLQRILSLGSRCVVELETHPVEPAEYRFLMTDRVFARLGGLSIARKFELASSWDRIGKRPAPIKRTVVGFD